MVRILFLWIAMGGLALGQGVLSLRFYEPVMAGLGLPVGRIQTSAPPESPGYLGFALEESAIADGSIAAEGFRLGGGFTLGGKALPLTVTPGPREVVIAPAFVLKRCHRGAGRWMQGDLCLAPAYAEAIGQPEQAGRVLGLADLVLPPELDPVGVHDPGLKGGDCTAPFGADIDVQLTDIDDIGAVHWDADRVAFAPSAVLHNIGSNAIHWYWAIAPFGWNGPKIGEHPFLALHLYRLSDTGHLVQLGRSDLKHAWNTVNFSCPCPGGQVMWPGCMDVYGVANNANQYFFGPRDELTAHQGRWDSLGSHFDATPVDDQRDHFDQPGEHDPFEHRLVVDTADLQMPGARYFVEAWYIAAGDTHVLNSIGYREMVPLRTVNGTNDLWTFSFVGPFQSGPAIGVLPGVERVDTGEGNVLVAGSSTALPGGGTHYRYTLMNLDYDRQLVQFEVPVVAGSGTTGHGFEDGDKNTANDWSAAAPAGRAFWSGPPVDWGRMVSFEFESDAAGLAGTTEVLPLEPSGIGAPDLLSLSAAVSPRVAPGVIPVITLSEAAGLLRCTWNAVPGASYRVQYHDGISGWVQRGVTVVPTSTEGEYLESNPADFGLFRVQLLSLPD